MLLWRLPDLPNQLFNTDYLRVDKFFDLLKKENIVNIKFDIIGKYVSRLLSFS